MTTPELDLSAIQARADAAVDLDKLEELERAATPGPFATLNGPYVETPDSAFLLALRNAAPSLFREVRRLRKLEGYAGHVRTCALWFVERQEYAEPTTCDCGFEDASKP